MGRGGAVATHTSLDDDSETVNSIRLRYPKSSRLLLGTTTNIQQPGFLKALETRYPLELSIECHNLHTPPRLLTRLSPRTHPDRTRHIRPFALFFYRNGGVASPWELIGRTETVLYDDYHRFVTKLKVCCATQEDRRKELRVEVYDRRTKSDRTDDQTFVGAGQCSLEDIISQPLLRREIKLESMRVSNPGTVVISADAIKPCVETQRLCMHVDMASITKGQHRVFFVLSRQLQSGDYTAVYRSEVLGKDEKKFRPVVRDVAAITAGVEDKLLRLEIFQYASRGAHTRLGFMQTSVDKLRKAARHSRLLWWPSTTCDGDSVIEIGRIVVLDSVVANGDLQLRLRVTQ